MEEVANDEGDASDIDPEIPAMTLQADDVREILRTELPDATLGREGQRGANYGESLRLAQRVWRSKPDHYGHATLLEKGTVFQDSAV